MDGRNRSVIHNTGLVWPNGLTLDFQNQVLYWADASLDVIESSNVDGSNRMLITDFNVLHPFGLALFDGILHFTDWSGPSVKSVDPMQDWECIGCLTWIKWTTIWYQGC